jgi:hypothetical protein
VVSGKAGATPTTVASVGAAGWVARKVPVPPRGKMHALTGTFTGSSVLAEGRGNPFGVGRWVRSAPGVRIARRVGGWVRPEEFCVHPDCQGALERCSSGIIIEFGTNSVLGKCHGILTGLRVRITFGWWVRLANRVSRGK